MRARNDLNTAELLWLAKNIGSYSFTQLHFLSSYRYPLTIKHYTNKNMLPSLKQQCSSLYRKECHL